MPNNDSHQHVVKTSAQWNERAIEYWVVPRGCLCVELTPRGKTKIKVGEGDKNYYQLPYIFDHDILLNYYTKEEVDNLFNNLNRMAIMSTDEYDSRSDLPHTGNKLGDVRFVKSASPSIKIDPDMYVWNGTKWIFVGNPMVDLTPYVTKEEFNVVKDKVDEIYPKAHTHDNKELLDNITQADRDKFDDLHNYDDTEIRELIDRSVHTHPNKDLLDTIMGYSILSYSDRVKFDNLHNYDDTEVKVRLVAVEEKAHVHRNKAVLDGITQEKLDEIDELAATYTIVKNDITDLKSKSHVHPNKDILDGTTAAYTVDQQRELQRVSNIDIFIGAGPTWDGVFGYVPAPEQGQQTFFLRADGTWSKVKSGGDKYKAGEGIYILSGETTSDSFPFKVYSRAGHLEQYIIYGNTGGVGDAMVGGMYGVNITVTDEHGNSSNTSVILPEKISLGDYIDYGKQVFVHMRTDVSSLLGNIDPDYSSRWAIYPDGSIQPKDLGAFGTAPQVTSLVELEPGVTYELYHQCVYTEFEHYMNLNVYDTGQNRTRTINFYETTGNVPTIIALASNEKYIRVTYGPLPQYYTYTLIRVKAVETPITLPQIPLFPNSINTINVTNTIKPAEIYVEVAEPSEDDPEDPMSDFTGIIYNDGVLDITQEDPTNLAELTVHFRDTTSTITVPGTEYTAGTGIQIGGNIIYNRDRRIPSDTYRQVGYIESDGTGYIMTNMIPTGRTYYQFRYRGSNDSTYPSGAVFGENVIVNGNNRNGDAFFEYWNNSPVMCTLSGDDSGSGYYTSSSQPQIFNHDMVINHAPAINATDTYLSEYNGDGGWRYDSHLVGYGLGYGTSKGSSTQPIAIFGVNTYDMTNDTHTVENLRKGRFYMFAKFEGSLDNDHVTNDLRPCYRLSDDKIGLYDAYTNTFFPCTNDSAFTCGPDLVDIVPIEGNVISAKLGKGLTVDSTYGNITNVGVLDIIQDQLSPNTLTVKFADSQKNITIPGGSGGNNYRAGDGIEITTIYPPQQGFQVEDTDYYFDTNVQCTIGGRIFTKYTTDPALGVICHARIASGGGQSTVYSGPMFFGLSENAVKVHNDYSGGQTEGSMGTFEYKGYTWYISAHNYMNDGTTIVDGGIPRIDDLVFTFDGNGEIELGKMVIDLAGLITDPIDEFSAKLGDGLQFDANGAIEVVGGGGSDYLAGTGIRILSDEVRGTTFPLHVYANGVSNAVDYTLTAGSHGLGKVTNLYSPLTSSSVHYNDWARDSSTFNGEPVYRRSWSWYGVSNEIYLDVGTYTFSLYAKSTDTTNIHSIFVLAATHETSYYHHLNEIAGVSVAERLVYLTNQWERYSITFNVTRAGYVACRLEKHVDNNVNVYISCYQLERGSVATPYSHYNTAAIPVTISATGETDRSVSIELNTAMVEGESINYIEDSLVALPLFNGKENIITVDTEYPPAEMYVLARSGAESDKTIYNTGLLSVTQDPVEINKLTFGMIDGDVEVVLPDIPDTYIEGTGISFIGDTARATSYPITIYANETSQAIDYTIYGASGNVGDLSPNIYPPWSSSSVNRNIWTLDNQTYHGNQVFYRYQAWGGLASEVYLDVGIYTFSLYMKANDGTPVRHITPITPNNEPGTYPHYNQGCTVSYISEHDFYPDSTWRLYSVTFEVTTAGYAYPRIERYYDGSYTYISCPQLVRGDSYVSYEPKYGKYYIPITVSAEGENDILIPIELNAPLGNGDSVNYVDDSLPVLTLYQNTDNVISIGTTVDPSMVYIDANGSGSPSSVISINNLGLLSVEQDQQDLNHLTFATMNSDIDITIPSASVMEGATASTDGAEGLVPAPLAGDENKFLRGDGTWEEVSGGASYIEGNGIELIGTTEVDINFDYTAFVNSLTGAYNGTLTKNVDGSITITPSSASGSWTVPDIGGGSPLPYTFNVGSRTTYKLTWDSGDDTVNGTARVFENAGMTTMYIAPQSDHELTFTTSNSCSYISIRFEETDLLPMTISNVKLYRLDASAVSINAKLGNGLHFDANGAIEADGGASQYVRVSTTDSFVLLHTKPADWDDHWDRYFELSYDEITSAPVDWDPTRHYKYENDNYVLGTAGDTFVSTTWYDKHYNGLDPNTAVTFDSDVYYTGDLQLIEDGETYDTAFAKINEAIEHIERLEEEVDFLKDDRVGVRVTSTPERIEFYNT